MSFLTLVSGKQRICFEKYVIKTENQHLWWMFVTLTVDVCVTVFGGVIHQ